MLVHMCDKKGCSNRAYSKMIVPIPWIDRAYLEKVEISDKTYNEIDLCIDHETEFMSLFQNFINTYETKSS